MGGKNRSLTRREFLQSGAMAAAAAGAVPMVQPQKGKKEPVVDAKNIRNFHKDMRYRRMGNTDVHLSVLSLGGSGLERTIAFRAIEQGVNLVHIGYDYRNGKPMADLAEVLKTKRDKVYVALKDGFQKEAPDDIDPILKLLGTDHVDFIMFNRHKVEAVNDPAVRKQYETWKAQGKVRYCGLTTHDNVKDCIAAGIENGWYTIIHPALPQSGFELAAEELKRASEKGIGILAMKTVRGINDPGLQMAQCKKILSNPAVTSVNKGISTFEMLNGYLKTVQETLTAEEDFSLYRYAQQNRANTCMMCGSCERVCPRGIEISTLLRSKTYYRDQLGDRASAAAAYRELTREQRHDGNCLACGKCESVCPNGIRIVRKLNAATEWFRQLSHRDLS